MACCRIDAVATCQRSGRRRAVCVGAHLADRAGQLRAERSGLVLQHRRPSAPANFVGRVGAFLAELSFQLFGYGSYLLPAIVVIAGWHYFWCRQIDAVYTKVVGARAGRSRARSAFMSLALGSVERRRPPVSRRRLPRRVPGGDAGRVLEPHRLDHRHSDAAVRRGHPGDAVLVRPALQRALHSLGAARAQRFRAGMRRGSTSGARRASAAR